MSGGGATAPDSVLQAVITAAVEASGALDGWIASALEAELTIVAAAGEAATDLVGRSLPARGCSARFVIDSGQPVALTPHGDTDEVGRAVMGLTGRQPSSILSAPCSAGGRIVGAIELVDKAGGDRFSFDDLEIVALLAGIAATAIIDARHAGPDHPSADVLAAGLHSLSIADPTRFSTVAGILAALLGS